MNVCHFCGPTEDELTKEELWPKWFSRLLHERGVKKLKATRVYQGEVLNTWQPSNIDQAADGVCRKCNNVVLSDLENLRFKPLITRSINTKRRLIFDIDDQATLIAWITRFVMVSDLKFPGDPFFTAQERKHFIDVFLPPDGDAWIWISALNSTLPAGCTFSRQDFSDGSTGVACTGIAGRIVFQFLMQRWNEPRPHAEKTADAMAPVLLRFNGATTQIYPPVDDAVAWPPPQYFDDESFKAFAARWGGYGRIKA